MRKIIAVCSAATIVLALIVGWNWIKGHQAKEEKSPIIRIGESPCAKFEYSGSKDGTLFITSEIKTLSNTFLSIDLEKSDRTVSDWIYRITFNCRELVIGGQEIVVLIGPNTMSINGETYCTPENVPFKGIVELFDSKYKFFADRYLPKQDS